MPSLIAANRKKEVSDPAAPQADDPECFLRLPKVPSEMSTDCTTQTSRSWLAMSVNGGESAQGDPALESTRLTRSGQRLSQALCHRTQMGRSISLTVPIRQGQPGDRDCFGGDQLRMALRDRSDDLVELGLGEQLQRGRPHVPSRRNRQEERSKGLVIGSFDVNG